MDRVARRGPLAQAPWRAKSGKVPKLSTFLSHLRGRPFGDKTKFRKRSHNVEILEGTTLWGFSTSILSQNIKKLKGEIYIFGKKVSLCRKKIERGDPFLSPSILSQNSKKMKGNPLGNFFFRKKVSQSRKKIERGDPLVSPGLVCYAGKQENPFGSVR